MSPERAALTIMGWAFVAGFTVLALALAGPLMSLPMAVAFALGRLVERRRKCRAPAVPSHPFTGPNDPRQWR